MTNIDTRLSKSLSWLLRHGARESHTPMRDDGFVSLDDVMSNRQFHGVTVADIERIVMNCKKQRFAMMTDDDGQQWIRANQGHTLTVDRLEDFHAWVVRTLSRFRVRGDEDEVDLTPILAENAPTTCIHGTTSAAWPMITERGLSRMNRQHVHMAEGMPDSGHVISGMRSSCDVHIHVDAMTAIRDGIPFYRSANGVILSPGNGAGVIPSKYFTNVVHNAKNK